MISGLFEKLKTLSVEEYAAMLAIAGALVAVLAFLRRWFRSKGVGKEGRNELRRIYRRAASRVVRDRSAGETVKRVIASPEFFEQLVTTETVSRRDELDAFRQHLCTAWPHRTADEVTEICNRIYDKILDGLSHSEYETWKRRAEHWKKEISAENKQSAARRSDASSDDRQRMPGYMRIMLSDKEQIAIDAKADAESHFHQPSIAIAEIPRSAVVQIGQDSPEVWEKTLVTATKTLGRLKQQSREVHLVCVARWLWCYALGVEIQVHHPLVLYHYQDGNYHRIWQINRQIKELKSPLATDEKYQFEVCGEPKLIRDGSDTKKVILALAIGSHRNIDKAFDSYRDEHLPDVPVWEVRRRDELLPHNPKDWIGAATDLAYVIDRWSAGGSKEVYLFGIMPAVLGLMFGSAVGPYRRVHLLQFGGNSYTEMMELLPRTISPKNEEEVTRG